MLQAVLALDMVSSTRLRSAVGDARFEPIRARLANDLTGIVTEAGGEVLLGTGDGAEAGFPSVTSAIEAAVQLQRAIHRARSVWATDPPVMFRMAITAGHSEQAAERAHALCDLVEGDQIALAPGVASLAGTWPDPGLVDGIESAGDHDLVRWHPTTLGQQVGLPPSAPRNVSSFVGRESERARLAQLVEADRPAAVLIEGEAGIGKTELTAVAAADAIAEGATVLWGACTEQAAGTHQPIVEALDGFVSRAPLPSSWLGPAPFDLARLSSQLYRMLGSPDLTELDPEAARLRALDAVAGWIQTLAVHAPVVLVVDDVQWATATTRSALLHVLRKASPRVSLVMTQRAGALEADQQDQFDTWLGDLARTIDLESMSLDGLDEAAARSLVRSQAADGIPDTLLDWMVSSTRGHPFYLEQLARHVETLSPSDDSHAGIPTGLRQTVQGRLATLPQPARDVLELAAVLGDDFDAVTLMDLLDPDVVEEGLEAAAQAGIIRETDPRVLGHRFVHSLTRQVVHDGLSGLRRSRHHQRVHEVFANKPERERTRRLAEIAHHALQAAPLVDLATATEDVLAASDHLRRTLAPDDAAALIGRGLVVVGDDPECRLSLLVAQAEAWQDAGDPRRLATSDEAARLALEVDDREALARAVLARSRGLFTRAMSVTDAEVERLRSALEHPPSSPDKLAPLHSHLAVELSFGDQEQQRSAAEAAEAIAAQADDPRVLGRVLANRLWSLFHPMADRQRVQDRLDDVATQTGDPELAFHAPLHRYWTSVQAGHLDEAREAMDLALRAAARIQRPFVRWVVLHLSWLDAFTAGRWVEAVEVANEQKSLAKSMDNPDGRAAFATQMAWIDFETKDPAEARADAATMAQHLDLLPPMTWCTFARRAAELGVTDLAEGLARKAHEARVFGEPTVLSHLFDVVQLLEAALACGLEDMAADLLPYVEDRPDEHGGIVFATVGSSRRVLGLAAAATGDLAAAEDHLTRAIAANDAAGEHAWAARARLDLAQVVGTREPGTATRLVTEAAASADELGLLTIAERASTMAAADQPS